MTTDEIEAPDDQQETLDDLGETGKQYHAVINQADWTVETIIQQIDKGNIELNPDFQRREAWREVRKSQYIESLMINVPVPQIVLAERKDKRGKFIVIDGKQRLISLRQFYSQDNEFPNFSLSGLTIRTDLNGLDYDDLKEHLVFQEDLNSLDNSTIRTAVIKNWGDESFLYSVFLRLNTGSVPLSPQELRQALHPGEFVTFVDKYSQDLKILHDVMGLDNADPRMRDAELVIRYFAFRNYLQTYTGNLKPLLDYTAKNFNKRWRADQHIIQQQREDFEAAISTTIKVFQQEHSFRKWNGQRYERALNRAVFDTIMYYFSDFKTRTQAELRKHDVEMKFKEICVDENFRSSIEGTTKSIDAIFTRLKLWGEKLKQIGVYVRLPELVENKIVRGE